MINSDGRERNWPIYQWWKPIQKASLINNRCTSLPAAGTNICRPKKL